MKKLIKILAAAAILSYAGFFGEKYRLVLPPLSDFIDCAEEITDSLSRLGKKINFGGDQREMTSFLPLGS